MARRARRETTRRAPALLAVGIAVAGVIGVGVTVDPRDGSVTDAADGPTPAALSELAPPADALGSTWYCAGGTAEEAGHADHLVAVANFGDDDVEVVLTAIPGAVAGSVPSATPEVDELTIAAHSRQTVRLADLVQAPYAAAIVEAGRGEVAVEHSVTGEDDFDGAPCASSSSSTWYLAAGATTRDAHEELTLFNPFPDDAVVDITFVTPDGLRSPPVFSGLIVPGRRVVAVDVGAVVSRHPNVATSIVARSGRLVVDRLQSFDGSDGPAGLAVTPAAPAPALVWNLPDGVVGEGISEIVTVYNPTDQAAEVDVEVDLDPTDDPSQPVAADPFALPVPPRGFAQVDVGADDRVPDGRGHTITVRSQNGVSVVAERWIRAGAPATRSGLAATLAGPVVATRWLSPTGGATSQVAEILTLVNPAADGIARVTITAAAASEQLAIAGLEDLEVPAQGRVVIDLGQYIDGLDLQVVVSSTLPIVVERGVSLLAGGIAQSILIPSAPTASVPSVDPGGLAVS